MRPVIIELYKHFLTESADADELQYGTLGEELSAIFIHKAYMSLADLRHCAAFDIATLEVGAGQNVVAGLHAEVLALAVNEAEVEDA